MKAEDIFAKLQRALAKSLLQDLERMHEGSLPMAAPLDYLTVHILEQEGLVEFVERSYKLTQQGEEFYVALRRSEVHRDIMGYRETSVGIERCVSRPDAAIQVYDIELKP